METGMLEVKIKYHADITHIEKIDVGDWIDLRAAEECKIEEGQSAMISLGVSMKLPEGYEAIIVPRSSTFKKWGLIQTNNVGVIDNSYSGTNDIWRFPCYCLEGRNSMGTPNSKRYTIVHKDDRICQFRIQKRMEQLAFVEVDKLDDRDRGGFGSTGSN